MRPDEHKKKKNAAYKKKHNVASSSISTSSSSVKSKAKAKDESQSSKNDKRDQQTLNRSKTQEIQQHSSSESDKEVETNRRQGNAFKRREIVSNWQKYELEAEPSEQVTARGESFEKLLDMAGESMSHFRFRDELEWEEQEQDLGPGGKSSEFVSVNPASLSESLACIPLHRLLGVDADLFPEDQMSAMLQASLDQQATLPPSCSNAHLSGPLTVSTTTSKEKSLLVPSFENHPHVKSYSEKDVNDLGIREKDGEMKKTCRLPEQSTSENGGRSEKCALQTSLQDDDLDLLLDMDVGQSSGPIRTDEQNGDVEHRGRDNGKPSGLVKSEPSAQAQCLSAGSGTQAKGPEEESAELEDWLDSVLG